MIYTENVNVQWYGVGTLVQKSTIDNLWKPLRWTTKSIPSGIKWYIK
mgnify:CR=1 FL=1